jgi:small subunit ribosomal protein S20
MQKFRIRDWSMGADQRTRSGLLDSPAVANIKSQIKRNKQNEVRRVRNKAVRSSLKTTAKRVRTTTAASNTEQNTQLLREAARELDKAASKGVIHKRAAARRKSRLAREAARTASS